nr:MAG TPA: hypothetical protein [Bacteriophage sp.]DAQ98113.1 MAG TPA: hypothetical protein [Caudoviricetes sp.]
MFSYSIPFYLSSYVFHIGKGQTEVRPFCAMFNYSSAYDEYLFTASFDSSSLITAVSESNE